jgi:hypothetical protein
MSCGDLYHFVYLVTTSFIVRWRSGFECGILKAEEGRIGAFYIRGQNLPDKTETNRGTSLQIADVRTNIPATRPAYFCPLNYDILLDYLVMRFCGDTSYDDFLVDS